MVKFVLNVGENMKKMFILLLAVGLPLNSFAKPVTEKQLATYFIDNVKTSADKNIDLDVEGINRLSVICPAKSASGTLLIKKASYEFNKGIGVFDFENNSQSAPLAFIVPISEDENDFDSEIIGFSFAFKMPRGQFFVDVTKTGKVKAGVNISGESGITYSSCRIDTHNFDYDL